MKLVYRPINYIYINKSNQKYIIKPFVKICYKELSDISYLLSVICYQYFLCYYRVLEPRMLC